MELYVAPPLDITGNDAGCARARVIRERRRGAAPLRGAVGLSSGHHRAGDREGTERWPPGVGPREPIGPGPGRATEGGHVAMWELVGRGARHGDGGSR